jgi:hypothetical protein
MKWGQSYALKLPGAVDPPTPCRYLVKQDPSPELVDEYYYPSSQDTVGPKQPNETPSSSSSSSSSYGGPGLRFGRANGGSGLEGDVCEDWAYATEKHYPFYSADAADGDSGHKYKLYKLGHPVMDCYDMYGRRTLLPLYFQTFETRLECCGYRTCQRPPHVPEDHMSSNYTCAFFCLQ